MEQQTMTLKAIASELLANLAFLFVDETDTAKDTADRWLESDIDFAGPEQGTLWLQCPRGFAKLLAANLLGVDITSNDAEAKAEGAVTEFMNILCGHFVTTVYGSDVTTELSIPRIKSIPRQTEPDTARQVRESVPLLVSGFRVQLAHLSGIDATTA